MKNVNTYPAERELIFSTVMEIMEKGQNDIEMNMTKVVKAIAASGSYWLSFLNVIYSKLLEVKSELKAKDYAAVEQKLDLLTKTIVEIRYKI
jgi:hypothetical protein